MGNTVQTQSVANQTFGPIETFFLRSPHLSEQLFDSLDDKSLANCREVNRLWSIYLLPQKFLRIRVISSIVLEFHRLDDIWYKVFKKATTDIIGELEFCVKTFYLQMPSVKVTNKYREIWHNLLNIYPFNHPNPFHILACMNKMEAYTCLVKLTDLKNPTGIPLGVTPLHTAAIFNSTKVLRDHS